MSNRLTPSPAYSAVAIALHWLIAFLILANFVLVWNAEDAADAVKARLMGLHMATGILILLFSVARIVWRITHPAPPLDPGLKVWETALARISHSLFYFLMIAIPFAGWAMTSAFSGRGVNMYGLFEMPALPFAKSESTAGLFNDLHEIFATALFVLMILHVAAALKHHFVDRNTTLGRMLPFLRRR